MCATRPTASPSTITICSAAGRNWVKTAGATVSRQGHADVRADTLRAFRVVEDMTDGNDRMPAEFRAGGGRPGLEDRAGPEAATRSG